MSLSSYLIPRTVARYSTPYNKDIRILEEKGHYKLLVNGARQSGEFIRFLWQEAFAALGVIPEPKIRKILVLGVAGGTVITLLHAMYPEAVITDVDIDEKMIEIGKKYFGLSTYKLVVADAGDFVRRPGRWDMIVVDLFVGAAIPPFVGEDPFLNHIARILSPGGTLLVNYLYELEYKRLSDIFRTKLQKIFPRVSDTKIHYNRFFFVVK